MVRISAIVAAVFLVFGASAFAAEVTGTLIDTSCYALDKANTTNAHKGMTTACAEVCAMKGIPVGLLTDKGEVYEVQGDLAAKLNAKLVPHLAHKVTLTGEIKESDGKKTIQATALKMISK